jgi:adenosylcobinamide-phosphate synthase
MASALIVVAALGLDGGLGEPRRCHPLVGFGRVAQAVERRLHADSIARGVAAATLLLVPPTGLALLIDGLPWSVVPEALLLYLALGWRSLEQHAWRVRNALSGNDLPAARQRVGLLVSRDTATLDRDGVARATVESVLENGNDAIFAAIFWFVLAGAPGVVLYRLTNTLDAMWGYRNDRYRRFGWAAARLDDGLNFLPARLTALGYALVGNCAGALRCWRTQGTQWQSPNAGPVMAAGAGSLGVRLGGAAHYHASLQARPLLGEGRQAQPGDIERALRLIRRSLLLWVLLLLAGGWLADHVADA